MGGERDQPFQPKSAHFFFPLTPPYPIPLLFFWLPNRTANGFAFELKWLSQNICYLFPYSQLCPIDSLHYSSNHKNLKYLYVLAFLKEAQNASWMLTDESATKNQTSVLKMVC